MTLQVYSYAPEHRQRWDDMVATSRNGTFLHQRGFMEYHAERFVDASVLVNDSQGHCVAIMPANLLHDRVVSHGGLTYAGLLYSPRMRQSDCMNALIAVLRHYREQGVRHLTYKAVPDIFRRDSGQEDLYAIWRLGGQLTRRDVSTAVELRAPYRCSKGHRWSASKAKKAGIEIRRQADPSEFHALLTQVLAVHRAIPVHALSELRHLMRLFPQEIQLYEAVLQGQMMAAALVFVLGETVHTQYLANSPDGRTIGALDALIANLMQSQFADKRYLSLGISTTKGGTELNEGLIAQKEGFGGTSVCHDFYDLTIQ